MDTIASFTVDHLRLLPGVYVSRIDRIGTEAVTTFDIRMTAPNREPVINTAEIHAIEHIGAVYLRNRSDVADSVIYFGPMGCRTGFYLLMAGERTSESITALLNDLFSHIAAYEGAIPGATPAGCGNCLDMNLPMARWHAKRFLSVLNNITAERLHYPQ